MIDYRRPGTDPAKHPWSIVPGHRVTVWLADATQVGRFDGFDDDAIYVDGVRIRRVDIRSIEIH
jgi:hypothetical protein